MTQQRASDVKSDVDAVERTLHRAVSYLLNAQDAQGWWRGEIEANVAVEAEYLFLTHFLGVAREDRWRKIATSIMGRDLPGGGWALYSGGPPDLNITVEAYFALKLAGAPADHPVMQRARHVVLSLGGVSKTRVFTKVWLSLFGQYDWRGVPVLPVETILLPSWAPLNIYDFASWTRAALVPLLVIGARQPICPVPDKARIDELYVEPPGKREFRVPWTADRVLAWKWFFRFGDDVLRVLERSPWKPLRGVALKAAEDWLQAHQEVDGAWAGIPSQTAYALIALRVLGYNMEHPVMRRGMESFELASIAGANTWRLQPWASPVRDTAQVMLALRDAGLPLDHPALQKAARWLFEQQAQVGGDWHLRNGGGTPGGWARGPSSRHYTDADTTTLVLAALHQVRLPEDELRQEAVDRGLRWLLSMQSRNGGWGAFDVDNTRLYVTHLPFSDSGVVIDPPTEDVTGHVLELLGRMRHTRRSPAVRRALEYLRESQQKDGSWRGRWGVNYIYGTGFVLPAYQAIQLNMAHGEVRRGVQWLLSHQGSDGGWGETCASYKEPQLGGQGPSTPSQTAWALIALLAAGEGAGQAAARGTRSLLSAQRPDGAWDDHAYTGAGFPSDFYFSHDLYGACFPVMALGRYRALLARGQL
ncbi:MAG: squalene--hopene cyclase, partial [Chloroflexota bacterium]